MKTLLNILGFILFLPVVITGMIWYVFKRAFLLGENIMRTLVS